MGQRIVVHLRRLPATSVHLCRCTAGGKEPVVRQKKLQQQLTNSCPGGVSSHLCTPLLCALDGRCLSLSFHSHSKSVSNTDSASQSLTHSLIPSHSYVLHLPSIIYLALSPLPPPPPLLNRPGSPKLARSKLIAAERTITYCLPARMSQSSK